MFLNNAESIGYDNRESGLEAGNVQGAIDELANEAFLFLEVTESSTSGEVAAKSIVPYPKGFNRDNTFFVSGKYRVMENGYDDVYYPLKNVSYGKSGITVSSSDNVGNLAARRYWLIIKKRDLEKFES